jgi:hypothetical protein
MRTVGVNKNREVDVPANWAEGARMIANGLGAYHDRRGGNLARQSAAARVAHGCSASSSWPPIRQSRSSTCCSASANGKALG